MTGKNLLIGDIGGTNARFALVSSEQPDFHDAMTLQCAEFASADEAMRHYLEIQSARNPTVICLAAAGPVIGNTVQVTNNHWTLDVTEIAADFGIDAVRLLNDFEAVAYSIPQLQKEDAEIIGLPEYMPGLENDFTIAIVGPGTGLGTAGLVRQRHTITPSLAREDMSASHQCLRYRRIF